jgi:replicative DNA helicase
MSFEAEQAVLGSMILDPECIPIVAGKLSADMFIDIRNRKIFLDILKLNKDGKLVDLLLLRDSGNDRGSGTKAGIEYRRN